MSYSHLSILKEILPDDQIEILASYFNNLVGSAINNITISKTSRVLNCTSDIAMKVLMKCYSEGILAISYGIRCPECNTLIKRIDDLSLLSSDEITCYSCDESFLTNPRQVEILFSLIDSSIFILGQHETEEFEASARPVALEDSLENIILAGGINNLLFNPTDDEYKELRRMFDSISKKQSTTKQAGDTLENFTRYLFGLCSVFSTAGIKTETNQIDCFVRNKMFLNYGVLYTIGGRFFIECKNESKTPKGEYMSKLHSIIKNTNGKNSLIKLGIIISKEEGPNTFKKLANKIFLSENIIMIAICGKELDEFIKNKGNLLDLLERKIDEITLDSITDLCEAGLYNT